MVDYNALLFWLQALQFVVTGAIAAYVWVTTKNRVTNSRITELQTEIDSRIEQHGERIVKLEATLLRCAWHDRESGGFAHRIDELSKQIHVMQGRLALLDPIQEQLSRINDWLVRRYQND